MTDETLPVFPQPLIDAFAESPETPAFEYRGRPVTRGAVLTLIATAAEGLHASDLRRGSTLALRTEVSPEGFAVRIAAHLLGLRVIALGPGMAPERLGEVLAGGEVDAVAVDGPADTVELAGAAGNTRILRVSSDLLPAGNPQPHTRASGPWTGPGAAGRPGDTALVNLTSGSTGLPKGCVQSYRSMTAHWSWQPARWTPETERLAGSYGRYLLFGTLASAVMFEHLALCLLGGGTAVIPEPPLDFPQLIGRHRITAMLMTVPRLHRVLDVLRAQKEAGTGGEGEGSAGSTGTGTGTGSLRVLLVAGSPLTPRRLAEATELLGPVVYQGYGQTETGMLTLLTPGDIAARGAEVLDSVGRAWAGTRLSVRDEQHRPVPAGTEGEVWVRTPCAMSGYWQAEDEAAEDVRGGADWDEGEDAPEDGEADGGVPYGSWLRTRDLGRLDGDGFLRLTGRTREVVIVNAIVHYTGPVERALAGHPDVDSAYVVAAPDERTGEAAHAFVVPVEGRTPEPAALRKLVVAVLGDACVPATFTVVTEVPLTPAGKPDKRALLARHQGTLRG